MAEGYGADKKGVFFSAFHSHMQAFSKNLEDIDYHLELIQSYVLAAPYIYLTSAYAGLFCRYSVNIDVEDQSSSAFKFYLIPLL